MECPRCGRLPGNGHTEICALQGEIERLRTDKDSLMVGRDFLIAEIESLRATIERLREYARHDPSCKSWGRIPCPCDCGYDELMKELEESK